MRRSGTGSGGGTGMNKNVKPKVQAGPPSTNKVNPGGVNQLGNHLGNSQAIEPIIAGKAPQVPSGNQVALNSGQRPGQGRTIHGRGTQAVHGPANPGSPRPVGEFFDGFNGKR